jgi:hypothetical protein
MAAPAPASSRKRVKAVMVVSGRFRVDGDIRRGVKT